MKFSILICTLDKRQTHLERLMKILQPQITEEVEVLTEKDNGEILIGAKRNKLLERASGSYVAFIDDDDRVDAQYVSKILSAIETEPDCVGIEGIMKTDGRNACKFIHSLRYREWFEKSGVYFRNPNHLNPVKREIALSVKFPELNHGEDHDYSKRLLEHLTKEVYINGPIYFYDFVSAK
jgi:glycosyltransferase involved in cell wall biosynthesis